MKIGWTFGASITAAIISLLFSGLLWALSHYGARNLITTTAECSGDDGVSWRIRGVHPALEMYRMQTGKVTRFYGQLVL
jgi:uncharacterized oligopeptide transporter (OPT) family protein